jgi:hypothetical protein
MNDMGIFESRESVGIFIGVRWGPSHSVWVSHPSTTSLTAWLWANQQHPYHTVLFSPHRNQAATTKHSKHPT